jgi:hypothetical protein
VRFRNEKARLGFPLIAACAAALSAAPAAEAQVVACPSTAPLPTIITTVACTVVNTIGTQLPAGISSQQTGGSGSAQTIGAPSPTSGQAAPGARSPRRAANVSRHRNGHRHRR